MAFIILVKGIEPETGEPAALEYVWNTGDEKPMPDNDPFWLKASGRELEEIRRKFENIPITWAKVNHVQSCQWSGEMAKFIFDNL